MSTKTKAIISVVLAVLIVLSVVLSFNVKGKKLALSTIEYLDEKEDTVKILSLGTVALSTALSFLPDDHAAPIAGQIAEFVDFFLILLAVLFTEKYLLSIVMIVAFRFIIPVAIALFIAWLWYDNPSFKNIGIKLFIFGLAISLTIPCSVAVSKSIEDSFYELHTKVEESYVEDVSGISESTETQNTMPVNNEASVPEKVQPQQIVEKQEEAKPAETESKSLFDKLANGTKDILNEIKDTTSKAYSSVKNTVEDTIDFVEETAEKVASSVENALSAIDIEKITNEIKERTNYFMESIAILIVTSCVIPALTLLFLAWILKTLFNIELPTNKLKPFKKKETNPELPEPEKE